MLFNLYATSAVTAAAFDGARLAAGSAGDRTAAEAHVREVLGAYAARPGFAMRWEEDPRREDVILTVRADNPSFLPPSLRTPLGFDTIERTVRVRIERAP